MQLNPKETEVRMKPLRGGLESAAVLEVAVNYVEQGRRRGPLKFVVKRVAGTRAREASIYRGLLPSSGTEMHPKLLAVEDLAGESRLYLEMITRTRAWPWKDRALLETVVTRLAHMHKAFEGPQHLQLVSDWDYEGELIRSGQKLVEFIEANLWREQFRGARRDIRHLRRVVSELPKMRQSLFALAPFGKTVIHGDMHTGNVLTRRRQGREDPVLLDWARVRPGSPLEDLSSWLQSLSFWEPEARRRHDTLFRAYLAAAGHSGSLHRELRDAYWIAAASNLLAGAIQYHLFVSIADEDFSAGRRAAAVRAANDALRVVRRADACWFS